MWNCMKFTWNCNTAWNSKNELEFHQNLANCSRIEFPEY